MRITNCAESVHPVIKVHFASLVKVHFLLAPGFSFQGTGYVQGLSGRFRAHILDVFLLYLSVFFFVESRLLPNGAKAEKEGVINSPVRVLLCSCCEG